MKNIIKKLTAAALCAITLTGSAFSTTQAFAAADSVSPPRIGFTQVMEDYAERIMSLFIGSTNKKSDIEFTAERGEIFAAKKHFNSAHASTVVKMSDGNLLSAWFAGSGEGNSDVRIWYSVCESGEWSTPVQLASEDTVAHWNPVLQDMGDYVRLYYKVGENTKNWVTKYCDTYDCGKTWTSAKELVEGDTSGGRGPVKNKCIVTSDGVMIAPASTEQGKWRAFFDISTDGGATWEKTDYIVAKDGMGKDVEMIQPTLWEDKEGNIHAMFRTKAGRIYKCDSYDGGYTWSDAYAMELMNNSSGIDCVMTDNGWLWLAYNPIGIEGFRNKLILSVSKDNGETWEDVIELENKLFGEYSYPSIIADGNTIYLTYTYTRTKINYTVIEF